MNKQTYILIFLIFFEDTFIEFVFLAVATRDSNSIVMRQPLIQCGSKSKNTTAEWTGCQWEVH